MLRVRLTVIVLLLFALAAGALPALAQDNAITLDEAGFGLVKNDSLAAQSEAAYIIDLKAGDRVAMDLEGENDNLQVTQFAASYGALDLQSPAPFNYMAWAPEDGTYTITVKNSGDAAAGFTLRVAVSAAPLPAKKILTIDADGQTIPVMAGAPFQVALDAQAADGYSWTLGDYDKTVIAEDGDPAMVLLGTMPGAMSQQIFTFSGTAAGSTALPFAYGKEGADPEKSYSVTIEVSAPEAATPEAGAEGQEPTPVTLTLDDSGKAQATGSLEPQGVGSYVVNIKAGAQTQAAITPADANFVLTVVGADGNPLLTDHAGASSFDQTMPVDQDYTFKVINFGDGAQDYTFDIQVGAPATEPAPDATPYPPQPITVDPGNVVVVPLAGNPTTGYIWQSKVSADGVLVQRGESSFLNSNPDPNIAGSGGYEVFTFDAAAPGEVTVTFTHSQPWDDKTPPEQVIEVPFVVSAPVIAAEPPALPAPVTIGEAENGSTVEVQVGGMLNVDLPGNPTTGYIWQITNKDDAVLNPTDYAFQPDSDAMGAGGVEHFEFEAMAPGEVKLEFAQSRPWETDAEPSATYSVTVKVVDAGS